MAGIITFVPEGEKPINIRKDLKDLLWCIQHDAAHIIQDTSFRVAPGHALAKAISKRYAKGADVSVKAVNKMIMRAKTALGERVGNVAEECFQTGANAKEAGQELLEELQSILPFVDEEAEKLKVPEEVVLISLEKYVKELLKGQVEIELFMRYMHVEIQSTVAKALHDNEEWKKTVLEEHKKSGHTYLIGFGEPMARNWFVGQETQRLYREKLPSFLRELFAQKESQQFIYNFLQEFATILSYSYEKGYEDNADGFAGSPYYQVLHYMEDKVRETIQETQGKDFDEITQEDKILLLKSMLFEKNKK